MLVAKAWAKRIAKAICMAWGIEEGVRRVVACGQALDIEEV